MAKVLTLSFPVKSATTLASQLGVSKSRRKRIFEIVAKAAGRNGSRHMRLRPKRKAQGDVVLKSAAKISRLGRRTHAKSAKAAH